VDDANSGEFVPLKQTALFEDGRPAQFGIKDAPVWEEYPTPTLVLVDTFVQ
jgi:hypothetical protein